MTHIKRKTLPLAPSAAAACTALLLAMAAAPALAQSSVTRYSVMEAAIVTQNHASPDGGRIYSVNQAGEGFLSASRFGLQGVEDLGSGMKARFVLENGFNSQAGTFDQQGQLLGRQAFVALQGGWGEFALGRQYTGAGAAMIRLEDQAFPKRCGHLDGKGVVPVQEMIGKVRAAVDARHDARTPILARTDAVAVEGLDAALDRAERYLEAGADALFIEALRSPEQMAVACARFAQRVPLLANMVEGGKTPVQSAQALADIGFRIVIFPGGTARAVASTLQGYYANLHAQGTTAAWRERMLDFDGLNAVIGTPALLADGKQYE